MDLIIRINLDNAAFEDDPEKELEHIFEQVYANGKHFIPAWYFKPLRDSNGNTVGTVEVTE